MKYWTHSITLVENCNHVSEGCLNCWSEEMANRFHPNQTTPDGKWTGEIRTREDRLPELLKGKKPRVIQIWNDLMHSSVPDEFIENFHEHLSPNNTYLVLTKRAERMRDFYSKHQGVDLHGNVFYGVTTENQRTADERIPYLLQVPGKRWLSIEPLLEEVDILKYILYNKMYETSPQGEQDIRSGEDEAFRDHARRHDMEGSGVKRQQMEQPDGITKDRAKTSGARSRAISSNILEGDGLYGSSSGMETFPRGDTRGEKHKPQEWEKERQCPRESGISNGIRKYETRISDRIEGRNGRKESELQTNKCPDRSYSDNLRFQDNNSNTISENVQRILPNSVESCKRREPNKTERLHGRLYLPTSEDKTTKKQERPISACVVGCETGKNARPCKVEWIESVVDQCKQAGVPVFVKAININGKITSDITKFPESLGVRTLAWAK